MKTKFPKAFKNEWLFVVAVGFLTGALALFPTVYSYFNTPKNKVFLEVPDLLNKGDIGVYFDAMRQGKEGNWLWENRFTSEPSGRYPFFTFYTILGHISRISGVSSLWIYLGAMAFMVFATLCLAWIFLKIFFEDTRVKKLTFILFALSCGAGFYFPEEHSFFTSTAHPHWLLSYFFFWAALFLVYKILLLEKFSPTLSALLAIFGVILGFVHPYSLFSLCLISFFWVVVYVISQRKSSRFFLEKIFFLLPMYVSAFWFLLLMQFIFSSDRVLSSWRSQQILPTPQPWMMLAAFGFLSILIVYGAYTVIFARDRRLSVLLIVTWLLVQFGLMYAPFNFQLLFSKGICFPVVVLAGLGLERLINKRFSLAILFVSLCILGSFGFAYVNANSAIYLREDISSAFGWLEKNAEEGESVFSTLDTGNLIPMSTGLRSFAGYPHMTPNFPEKYAAIKKFYSNSSYAKNEGLALLRKYDIGYIFLGPWEREGKKRVLLNNLPYLSEVFSKGRVTIFKVL